MSRVVVIGGGISGLSCARLIQDKAPGTEVVVLEASKRSGGTIRSGRDGGFLWEAGPSGFLNRDPSTLAIAERVGLADEIICGDEQVRRRYILSDGRLRRFPDSPRTFMTSDLLSVRARARVLMEPAVAPAPAGADETVGQFARRRLGREAAELLVDPVVSGIYAGDPDRLSVQAAVPHLAGLDGNGKSLIRGLLQTRRRPDTPSSAPSGIGRSRYVSFRGGIGQLTDALARSLGPSLHHNSPVTRVRRDKDQWRVEIGGRNPTELLADVVVSAAPGPAARGYLGGLHPRLDEVCGHVPYAPVTMVALGYREADIPNPLAGFGYLVPSREGGNILGVLWSTSIFPGQRGDRGKVLLQAVLGGARNTHICQLDDQDLVHQVQVQLRQALGIAAAPITRQVHRHNLGIPQYQVGHKRRLQRAEAALLSLPGLLITGNAFRGVGINTCTAEAGRVSDAVASYLGALPAAGLGDKLPQIHAERPGYPG